MRGLLFGVMFFLACGVDQPANSSAASKTSQALHCGTEPTDNGNGTATVLGCPFEQQLLNIRANGTAVPSGHLLSQGQSVAFTSDFQCGEWVMGTDAQGAQVFVSTADGTVRSHGAVHPGFPSTVLPAQLQQPVTLAP